MKRYSQLSGRNIVVKILDTNDSIATLQERYGGLWIDYEINETYGSIGRKYSLEHDIFIDPSKPIDVNGDVCNSWALNTVTGRYEPPFESPSYTEEDDDNGLSYYWHESEYQADNTTGWVKMKTNLQPGAGTCYDEHGNPWDCSSTTDLV